MADYVDEIDVVFERATGQYTAIVASPGGAVLIVKNHGLSSLEGLGALVDVGGKVKITYTDTELESLEGLGVTTELEVPTAYVGDAPYVHSSGTPDGTAPLDLDGIDEDALREVDEAWAAAREAARRARRRVHCEASRTSRPAAERCSRRTYAALQARQSAPDPEEYEYSERHADRGNTRRGTCRNQGEEESRHDHGRNRKTDR